jgi:hypothetical protein
VRLFKDAMMDKSREAAGQMEKMNGMSDKMTGGMEGINMPQIETLDDLKKIWEGLPAEAK